MKKSFLLLISIILMNFAFAQSSSKYYVSAEDAQQIGTNFHSHQAVKLNSTKYSRSNYTVKNQATLKTANGYDCIHIFNYNDGGFTLVSADMRTTPILAYSFEGEFNVDNISPETKSWIEDNYMPQFDIVEDMQLGINENVAKQWKEIRNNDFSDMRSTRGVEPLVETKWDQAWPYNIYCPEHPEGPGGHTYAGCVATAMAQVMNYWQYPETGKSSFTFFYGDYFTVNFGETNYAWDDMTIESNIGSREAIAELIYHCGASVDMNWGYDGSGAQTEYVPYALKNYFKYRTGVYYLNKDNTTDANWKFLLKEEIDKGHPLVYSGTDIEVGLGHAFVCDAYQDTSYFHFNWGWSGSGNGYYFLDDLAPMSYDFTYAQGAVYNITPNNEAYCVENTIYTLPEMTFGDGSGDSFYFNDTYCDWIINPQVDSIELLRLTFTKFDLAENDVLKIYKGSNSNPSLNLVGEYTSENRPYTIDNWNGNKFYLVFETDGEGQADGWEAHYSTIVSDIEINKLENISLYPNPANETITINGISNSDIAIYDIYGKLIKEYSDLNSSAIDISDMSDGIYFMNVSNKDGIKTLKFVKD